MPLADFLARLGHEPVRRSGNELWYLAPYRGAHALFPCERGETALVRLRFGQGRRHLHACREFLQSDDFMEASEVHSGNRQYDGCRMGKAVLLRNRPNRFEDVEAAPLLRSLLTGIPGTGHPLRHRIPSLLPLNYGVRGKRYFAVGFPNVAGGYEVRSRRYFKGLHTSEGLYHW